MLASSCSKGANGLRLGDVYQSHDNNVIYVFKRNSADCYQKEGTLMNKELLKKTGFSFRSSGDTLWMLVLNAPVEYIGNTVKVDWSSCMKESSCGATYANNGSEILEIKSDGLALERSEGGVIYKDLKPENEFFTSELKSVPPDSSQ